MNLSFYSAAVGAMAQQERLNTIANNIANVNNEGYKAMTTTFTSLLYKNVRTPGPELEAAREGVGARTAQTSFNFGDGGISPTDYPLDFRIEGEGFFAVRDPATDEVYYTRTGSFVMSEQTNGEFLLATANGEYVLDGSMNTIRITQPSDDVALGVFNFAHLEGFTALGGNRYIPAEKNGAPIPVAEPKIERGVLEASNVELAREFSDMITTQRLYSFALQMVQTSDEVETTINNLRS